MTADEEVNRGTALLPSQKQILTDPSLLVFDSHKLGSSRISEYPDSVARKNDPPRLFMATIPVWPEIDE